MNDENTQGLIPFVDLAAQRQRLRPSLDLAIQRVMSHGQFVLGPEVGELEHQLAEFCGARFCITCANGTDALLLALVAEGVGIGDAVFIPAFTFIATAEAVVRSGAVPVLVDVRRDTFNLDPDSLAAAIKTAKTEGYRPRCVIPVDLFGQPADYSAILAISEPNNLIVVADAAQSFGAKLHGKAVGTLAHATATSFYPSKPLGCYGDGGAIFTDDEKRAEILRSLRSHGYYAGTRVPSVGINSRLDTLQAAILLEKLKLFPGEIVVRRRAAARYSQDLGMCFQVPTIAEGANSVWAQYTLVSDQRDEVVAACKRAGIPTAVHYSKPLHRQPAFRNCSKSPLGLTTSEWLAERVLSIPIHGYLELNLQERIVSVLRDAATCCPQ